MSNLVGDYLAFGQCTKMNNFGTWEFPIAYQVLIHKLCTIYLPELIHRASVLKRFVSGVIYHEKVGIIGDGAKRGGKNSTSLVFLGNGQNLHRNCVSTDITRESAREFHYSLALILERNPD